MGSMKQNIPAFLLEMPSAGAAQARGGLSAPFIDRTMAHISGFIRTSYVQWDLASRSGLFQKLDPRIKVSFLLFLIVVVSIKQNIRAEGMIAAFLCAAVITSRLDLIRFYRKVVLIGFLFGTVIALPSALNLMKEGEVVIPLVHFDKACKFWFYHIPETIGVTKEGIEGILMLTSRVMNSLTITFLLLHTTRFPEIIRSLKVFRVPDTILFVISLTYKYLFIFVKTIEEMHLAKKARLAGGVGKGEMRYWVAGRIAFMLRKSHQQFEEVFRAMVGRGFSGDMKLSTYQPFGKKDILSGCLLFSLGIIFLFW